MALLGFHTLAYNSIFIRILSGNAWEYETFTFINERSLCILHITFHLTKNFLSYVLHFLFPTLLIKNYELAWGITIIFIIFWDVLMFYQIFLSPQVKRSAIISNKHGTNELPNDLRLRKLGNIRKISKLHRMVA